MKIKSVFCALLVAVFATFSLAGCGQQAPSEVVESALTAFQKGDTAALSEACNIAEEDAAMLTDGSFADVLSNEFKESDGVGLTDKQKEIVSSFFSKIQDFDYVIGEEKIDGDKASVEITIKTYDFATVLENAYNKVLENAANLAFLAKSETEQMKAIIESMVSELDSQLQALKEKGIETKVTINLVKQDGAWVIDELSDEVYDAFLGGASSKLDSIF